MFFIRSLSFAATLVSLSSIADPVTPVPVPEPGFGEYSFINCSSIRRIGNHELRETFIVNLITTPYKKPYAVRGTYSFYNTAHGTHGYSQLTGNIAGRHTDLHNGMYNISLYNGKEYTNTEGFLGENNLYSVGFGQSLTFANYTTSNSFSPERFLTGCRVSNLALYNSIP
jgi:hypothetical protein